MDFTKLINILQTHCLYFCRADKLEDPFEGSFPLLNIKHRQSVYKELYPKMTRSNLEKTSEFAKDIRKYAFINSWHMNQCESDAMWKLYLKNGEGIAIQSTVGRLIDSFTDYLPVCRHKIKKTARGGLLYVIIIAHFFGVQFAKRSRIVHGGIFRKKFFVRVPKRVRL